MRQRWNYQHQIEVHASELSRRYGHHGLIWSIIKPLLIIWFIFFSNVHASVWSVSDPIPGINVSDGPASPFYYEPGNCIFGGESGPDADIVVFHLVGEEWVGPISLGSRVNTPATEQKPTVSKNGNILVFQRYLDGAYRPFWTTRADTSCDTCWEEAQLLNYAPYEFINFSKSRNNLLFLYGSWDYYSLKTMYLIDDHWEYSTILTNVFVNSPWHGFSLAKNDSMLIYGPYWYRRPFYVIEKTGNPLAWVTSETLSFPEPSYYLDFCSSSITGNRLLINYNRALCWAYREDSMEVASPSLTKASCIKIWPSLLLQGQSLYIEYLPSPVQQNTISISIFTSTGILLYNNKLQSGFSQFSTNFLQPGMYLINLSGHAEISTNYKIIIM